MKTKPYTVKVRCLINNADEEVHFFEIQIDGEWYLHFRGCDHEFHKCDACEKCQKDAYRKILNSVT